MGHNGRGVCGCGSEGLFAAEVVELGTSGAGRRAVVFHRVYQKKRARRPNVVVQALTQCDGRRNVKRLGLARCQQEPLRRSGW